jgi:RND family efflux transporter MFP subunit
VVKKGTLLAKLSSAQELATLNLARSRAGMRGELRAAEVRLDIAGKKRKRAEELVKQNFVSANAMDEADAEYRLATEQLLAARENHTLAEFEVKRAEEILAQRSILSPVNGIVAQVMLGPGELTASTQKDPIMSILEIDPLNVEVVLPVREIGRIKVGQTAVVTPDAPVGGRYNARVEVVDANLDATSGTFGVRLTLPNPANRIPAGARCRVRF